MRQTMQIMRMKQAITPWLAHSSEMLVTANTRSIVAAMKNASRNTKQMMKLGMQQTDLNRVLGSPGKTEKESGWKIHVRRHGYRLGQRGRGETRGISHEPRGAIMLRPSRTNEPHCWKSASQTVCSRFSSNFDQANVSTIAPEFFPSSRLKWNARSESFYRSFALLTIFGKQSVGSNLSEFILFLYFIFCCLHDATSVLIF